MAQNKGNQDTSGEGNKTNPQGNASVPKKKEKMITVKATRQVNFGKLEKFGKLLHFQKDEEKEVPYNKVYQPVIDNAVEQGFLAIIKE